jgi:Ala-tRNA(Pro) deacylase
MDCKAKLEQYFRDHDVKYQAMTHRTAYTAQELAAAQGVKGKQVAKVAMVRANGSIAMLVMPASHRIDFAKVQGVLGAQEARLAKEEEFRNLFPDCETGAMPPFGNLYNVPVYLDRSLTDDPEIVFRAGSHRDSMKIAYQDYAKLAQPVVADFAVHL